MPMEEMMELQAAAAAAAASDYRERHRAAGGRSRSGYLIFEARLVLY
jgi:hypothetical protein